MKYQLNVYGKDSEITKTVGTNFVPTGLFIRALKMGEELKETSSNKEFALNLLKKILQQYMQIQQKFSKESVIYKEITMASKSAISNVMGDFSADILPVYSALGVFFNDDAGRIRYLIGVLKIVKKEIEDEIGCAKS